MKVQKGPTGARLRLVPAIARPPACVSTADSDTMQLELNICAAVSDENEIDTLAITLLFLGLAAFRQARIRARQNS